MSVSEKSSSFESSVSPLDFISYIYKPLNNSFKSFGTRMRIIGRVENNQDRLQTPSGSTTYYQLPVTQPNQNANIGGGSGGIGIYNVTDNITPLLITSAGAATFISSVTANSLIVSSSLIVNQNTASLG